MPPAKVEMLLPNPAPTSLTAECQAGPAYPKTDAPLGEVLEVVAGREKAAADCRARHKGLSRWADAVTRGDLDGGRLDH
jgi:hypothetical protein